jgi:hypothetical protein
MLQTGITLFDSDFCTEIFGELVIYLNLCYCVSKS